MLRLKINPSLDSQTEELIEKGYDNKKRKSFYKIYFNEEK